MNNRKRNTAYRTGSFMALFLSVQLACNPLFADEDDGFDKKGGEKRPCNNRVKLFVDDEEQWDYSLSELRELDITEIPEIKRLKGKSAIPLAALLVQASDVTSVEIGTCDGKLKRIKGEELQKKSETLYFVITGYRGLKLYNDTESIQTEADEIEKKPRKKKGSRLKQIDRIRLITQTE